MGHEGMGWGLIRYGLLFEIRFFLYSCREWVLSLNTIRLRD